MKRIQIQNDILTFVFKGESKLLILVGNPGIGKSWLIRRVKKQLHNNKHIKLCDIFEINRIDIPEIQANIWLNQINERFKRKLKKYGVNDKRKAFKALGALPIIGELLKALLKEPDLQASDKIIEFVKLTAHSSEDKQDRVVFLIDPIDSMENSNLGTFIKRLIKETPDNFRLIINQRPSDFLLKMSSIKSSELTKIINIGLLTKSESIEMIELLKPNFDFSSNEIEEILKYCTGWPYCIEKYIEHYELFNDLNSRPSSLEYLNKYLFDLTGKDGMNVLIPLAIGSGPLPFEVIAQYNEIKNEELINIIEKPLLASLLRIKSNKFDQLLTPWHSLFTEYINDFVSTRKNLYTNVSRRLSLALRDWIFKKYDELDELNIADRDIMTMFISEVIYHYIDVLNEEEYLNDIADIVSNRISSIHPGGRSYSLFLLIILSKYKKIRIKYNKLETFITSLVDASYRLDTLLHPEYSLILLAELLFLYPNHISPELRNVITDRIFSMRNCDVEIVRSTANYLSTSVVPKMLSPINTLALEELYPKEILSLSKNKPSKSKEIIEEVKAIITKPLLEWSEEDKRLISEYKARIYNIEDDVN